MIGSRIRDEHLGIADEREEHATAPTISERPDTLELDHDVDLHRATFG